MQSIRSTFPVRILCAAILAVTCWAADGDAHTQRGKLGPLQGIEIESLTHGQMTVLSGYRREIVALATRQVHQDETFRRLLNYANIQFSTCAWGLMPGGVSDETSPFNECSHAYLAATRAVLLQMVGASPENLDAIELYMRIDLAMLQNDSAMSLCQYSGESFDTGRVVRPDWRAVPGHLPSLSAVAALAFMVIGGIGVFARATGSRRTEPTSPLDGSEPDSDPDAGAELH